MSMELDSVPSSLCLPKAECPIKQNSFLVKVAQSLYINILLGGSGHDLRVLGSSPTSGSLLNGESASLSPQLVFSLSQSIE